MLIVAYLLAIPLFILSLTVGSFLLIPFIPLTNSLVLPSNTKSIARNFLFGVVSSAIGVYLCILVGQWAGVRVTFTMLIIPLLLTLNNDFSRYIRARQGKTYFANESYLNNVIYDPIFFGRMEEALLVGHQLGSFLVAFGVGVPFY